jgi:hypothetical protein
VNRPALAAVVLGGALAGARVAAADVIAAPALLDRSSAGARLGLDATPVIALSYAHHCARQLDGRGLVWFGTLRSPLALALTGDSLEAMGGAATAIWPRAGWNVRVGAALGGAYGGSALAALVGVRARFHVMPGWFRARGYVGLDVSLAPGLATYVRHRDARQQFDDRYPDGEPGITGPRDGWYRLPGAPVRVRVEGGRALGGRVVIAGGLGLRDQIRRLGGLADISVRLAF